MMQGDRLVPLRVGLILTGLSLRTIARYDRISLLTLAKHYGVDAMRSPGWLLDWLRHGGVPPFTAPNLGQVGKAPPMYFGKVVEWMEHVSDEQYRK